MIMGADYYESEEEKAALIAQGKVPMGVGDGCVIQNAIIDKNARIGRNVTIRNKDALDELDEQANGYMIRSGIVVVLAGATIPDGSDI
jgi:glucose-1-phosphate adenylyltransferase